MDTRKIRYGQVTWGFTYNNPTHTADEMIAMLTPVCNAYTFQKEVGEEGTPHYQGYCRLKKKTTAPSKLVTFAAHWFRCDQNFEKYCSKEETRVEGPWALQPPAGARRGKQGERTDMDEAAEMLRNGSTITDVADLYPSQVVRYQQHFKRYQALYPPKRTQDLQVHLFTGKPGTGKTRAAYEMDPDLFALPVGKDLWFDNYMGQKTVLIDDFAGNVGLTQLLQILDRYPVQVPIKGGFVWWCPDLIIITTNIPLENWYDYSARQDSYGALRRRITHRKNFDELIRLPVTDKPKQKEIPKNLFEALYEQMEEDNN